MAEVLIWIGAGVALVAAGFALVLFLTWLLGIDFTVGE